MSGTTSWTPDKVTTVAARIITYMQATNALTTLQLPNASARVSLYVTSGEGSANFDFQLDITQAAAFFTPIVGAIRDELTAAGVDLSSP